MSAVQLEAIVGIELKLRSYLYDGSGRLKLKYKWSNDLL